MYFTKLFSMLLLSLITNSVAQTFIPPGNVSGSWTLANSPYYINGEITIPNDSTLIIEPGVEVIFTGSYEFYVQGRLLAIGTAMDTITFTAQDTVTGWGGMELEYIASSNDSTIFEYCTFQYGKAYGYHNGGAIYSEIDKLRISHCLFRNNWAFSPHPFQGQGGAIFLEGSPIIEYCEFSWNEAIAGDALVIIGSSYALIRNNHFHHNSGGWTIIIGASFIGASDSPTFINNLIEENHSNYNGILYFSNNDGNAKIINNTIVNNTCNEGGAIAVYDAIPTFINNIIYGNEPSQVYFDSPSSLGFYNCLIQGGKEGFTGATFTGAYENCIDADPQFVSLNDFHLQNTSPCIGAAIDSVLAGSTMYYCPPNDFEGNQRPNPSGSMPDIGAYENPNANPVGVEDIVSDYPTEYALSQNYPNPFNPTTTIKYSVPKLSLVTIRIYDVLGSEVATLVNEEKPVGTYELNWNAENLPSGVYFYQLKAVDPSTGSGQGFVETKKMILMK